VIDAAVETSRPLIEMKRHRFEIDLPETPIRFAADPLRLAQVLSNLLTNAAKYTDAGGFIRLVARADDRNVVLRVEDNGIGIPADAMSQVFRMFSQVSSARDRSEGGLGIGLSLAKGLTELHDGKLEVESRGVGRGSTFIVTLPRRSITVSTLDRHIAHIDGAKKRHRVLIADDNQDAAESLALLMRLDGHDADVVHDGPSALEAIRATSPDVAVLDIGMPGMNGYEVAEVVRQTVPKDALLLIAVTGWGAQGDVERATAAGFDYHFTKPVEPAKLISLLAD
jgi:CheY-like chemotaxis protein/anti-sigma regulatory factor (Ser/Thr protein kinase)